MPPCNAAHIPANGIPSRRTTTSWSGGAAFVSPVAAEVLRERARLASWRRVEVPNRFASEEVPAFGCRKSGTRGDVGVLRGTAVSPGDVEGPDVVRVDGTRGVVEHVASK